jgi:hypothetical protein
MRKLLVSLVVGLAVSLCAARGAHAQDLQPVPDDQAKPIVEILAKEVGKVNDAQIKVEVEVDKTVVLFGGAEMGIAFMPHKGLSEESVKKSDKDVAPLGVMLLYHLTPVVDNKPVPKEKLRTLSVMIDNETIEVPVFYVGVKTETDGKRNLVIYGKDKDPLVKVALNDLETKGERPVVIEAKGVANGEGTLFVNVLKKFQSLVPLKEMR